MKKIITIIATLGLSIVLCACGKEKIGMANPNKYDVGKDAMVQATGIEITAPDNATDVSYNIIGASTETPMSEVDFTLDGSKYCYRAQLSASELLYSNDPLLLMNDETFKVANISGIYTTWDSMAVESVENIDGVLATDKNNTLFVWHDVVPGVTYNLSVDKKLSIDEQMDFCKLAASIFVPLQGDAE